MNKINNDGFYLKKPDQSRGFTLLFASLVISLLLAIGLAIANISIQQFILSSSGKESQVAFYNADTGVECALFYDHGKVQGFAGFPTNSSEQQNAINSNQTITCAGVTSTIPPIRVGPISEDSPTTTTRYRINPANGCNPNNPRSFEIEVAKAPLPAIDDEAFYTIIRSRGYNTCDSTNPRRVERGLEAKY